MEIQEVPSFTPKKGLKRKNDPYKRRAAKNASKGRTRASRGKSKSVSKLKKELDTVFSKYIRYSAADKDGNATCYTCNRVYPAKKLHAGHYILRGYMSVRRDEMNVKPQCGVDNLWRKGEPVIFRENLVRDYGEQAVLALEAKRHELFKTTTEFLQETINHYQQQIASLSHESVR